MNGPKLDPREIRAMIEGVKMAIRPEKPAEHPRDLVTAHYGIKRRFYFEMESMGRKMGQSPPWLDPRALGRWFDLAIKRGLRKQPAPASVLARVKPAPAPGIPSQISPI